MNINSLLKSVNYDNERIDFFNYEESYFFNKIKGVALDTQIICIFDQETSEVLYMYMQPENSESAYYYFIKEYKNIDNVVSVSEKDALKIAQEILKKEPDEYIDFEMCNDDLEVIDELAAKLDITRNAMFVKILTQAAKEVLEKEDVS